MRTLLLFLFSLVAFSLHGTEKTYSVLGAEQGLKGQQVLQLLQLHDGRMVVMTESHVCIYDGTRFHGVKREPTKRITLTGYHGHAHLYIDNSDRLWLKDWQSMECLDLRTLRMQDSCLAKMKQEGISDFFVDGDGTAWKLGRRGLVSDDGTRLDLPAERAEAQDLLTANGHVYLFTADGVVNVFNRKGGKPIRRTLAYGESERKKFEATSLVVRGADGLFYQVRMGVGHSVLQSYNPQTDEWRRLAESTLPMHTLFVTPQLKAYVTTPQGYWEVDLRSGLTAHHASLRLPDGVQFPTGINAVCQDREGGVWLGSYGHGVFYASPLSGTFDTHELSIPLTPLLTAIYLHGQRLTIGEKGISEDASYVKEITMRSTDNSLAFRYSAMKYVRPSHIYYRYRVNGEPWTVATADSMVDGQGRLYLPMVGLSAGRYVVEVMAATDTLQWKGGKARLVVNIEKAWYAEPWLWVIVGLTVILVILYLVRCQRQKVKADTNLPTSASAEQIQPAEPEFVRQARELVERNLANADYSVEQLAADLCMERTGLYRKLTAMTGESPAAFMRRIRLERAAALLKEEGRSVSEVSDLTGFSSPQYFTKCFQKAYGCKPSEYK